MSATYTLDIPEGTQTFAEMMKAKHQEPVITLTYNGEEDCFRADFISDWLIAELTPNDPDGRVSKQPVAARTSLKFMVSPNGWHDDSPGQRLMWQAGAPDSVVGRMIDQLSEGSMGDMVWNESQIRLIHGDDFCISRVYLPGQRLAANADTLRNYDLSRSGLLPSEERDIQSILKGVGTIQMEHPILIVRKKIDLSLAPESEISYGEDGTFTLIVTLPLSIAKKAMSGGLSGQGDPGQLQADVGYLEDIM